MRPHACIAALAVAVHGYLPPLPTIRVRTRRLATVQDEPQQTRKEFTVPKAASTRETEVRAVTALSRDGNVSLPEVFVGNDGSWRQLYDNGVVMPVGWTGASTRRRTGSKFTDAGVDGFPSATPARIRSASRRSRGNIRRRSPLYAQDWFDGLRNPAKSAGACLFPYFAVLAPAVAFGGGHADGDVQGAGAARRAAELRAERHGLRVWRPASFSSASVGEHVRVGKRREEPRVDGVEVDVEARGDEWRRDGACRDETRDKDTKKKHRCLAGQPMTFVAPTGLTLSFIGAVRLDH